MSLTKVKAGNILLTTPAASSNDVTPATTAYVTTALANMVDSAPSTLNTLNELAAALGDDANFSTTVTNNIATKLPLAGGTLTGDLTIPSKIIHAGDTDTYLRFPGADDFRIVVGNSTRAAFNTSKIHFNQEGINQDFQVEGEGTGNESLLYVDASANNVGIGRTPTAYGSFKVLDLAGSSGAIQKLIHTGNTVELQSYASSTVGAVGTATSHPLLFTTGDAERLRIDTSGDLNIVNTGQASLNYTTDGSLDYARITGGKYGSGVGDLRFFTYSGGIGERMRIEADGNTHVLAGFAVRGTNTPASGKGIEMHQSGDDMHIYAYDRDNSAVKNLTLQNPGGNVGIGTTSPGALLEISGKDDAAGATDLLRLQFDNSPADTGMTFTDIFSGIQARFTLDSGNTNNLRISSGTKMHFYGGTSNGTGNGHLLIDSTGHVGIVAGKRFYLDNASIASGDTYIDEYSANEVGITTGGSRKLAVSGGNLYVSGSVNANHNFSDERLKDNVVVIPNALQKVSSLRGITFTRKDDGSVGTGLIAQELETVLPEAVYEAKMIEELENPDAEAWKSINYGNTVGLLVEAIKELKTKNEALEARITELES